MQDSKILHMGIDFGTSKSAISCDNGIRTFIPSYVGFPKDMVSRKLVGKDTVFGIDVLKNKLSLNLVRPLEIIKQPDRTDAKEYKQAMDAARKLLAHLIYIATEGNPDRYVIRGVVGVPALASSKIKSAFAEIAEGLLDSILIVSEPFAVAYGLNLFNNALIVDIGAGTIDICRMSGTIPAEDDQITISKAGDYIDQTFFSLIKAKYPDASITIDMVRMFKEENTTITDYGEKLQITLPVKGKPTLMDVTGEIREACRSVVADIVEGIGHLISTFNPEFQDNLKGNVILAGGGSQIIGLREEMENYMQKNLGYGKVRKVEEPVFAGANGALVMCRDMPEEYWTNLKETKSKEKGKKE